MKLRQIPEDFIVEEIADFTPDPSGRFFVYEIQKRSIATLDVIDILRKALRLPGHQISASGLKDKHALATQLVSLPKPLPASFQNPAFDTTFVGKSGVPLKANNIAGNRFAITARALREQDIQEMHANAETIKACGLPNYYDSQRFGGARREELVGRQLLLQNYQEALRLHLALPRRKQAMKDKRIRRICAKYWGDWEKTIAKLPRCRERSIVAYLCDHPDDFRGALERIDTKLTTLYLSAYQSLLFNDSLAHLISAYCASEQRAAVKYKAGELIFWRSFPVDMLDQFRQEQLALINHSIKLEDFSAKAQEAINHALEKDGIRLDQMVLKGFDRLHLHGSTRKAHLEPQDLELGKVEDDELNPGRFKCCARFALPRGSFATIVMKGLELRPARDQ